MNDIQDATTVAFFRERLRKAGEIEELFEMFVGYLRDQGLEARGSQIIDATLVPAPTQRNTREENKYIKSERLPDGWEENPNRLQQRDLDVRWVKKNGINHYGYMNSICTDAEHDFIRRFVVTAANIYDGQVLPMLLDPGIQDNYIWADFPYSGPCVVDLLSLGGFECRIHEKGSRNHPLCEAAKEQNSVRSPIRACVEHVFCCMTTSMGSKLTRKIGLDRNEAWWALGNSNFQFPVLSPTIIQCPDYCLRTI